MDQEEPTIQTLPADERSKHRPARDPKAWMQHPLLVPLSVVVAGAMIAVAIFMGNQSSSAEGTLAPTADQLANSLSEAAKKVRPVDATDHVLGAASAPITIIEFSDFQCPYCASFHPTLKQALADFDGKVRWVYRHFPLSQIHPEALAAGVASECMASLGGNGAFWQFADSVFAAQKQLGTPFYENLAQKAGINLSAFRACVDQTKSTAASKRVANDLDDALNAGGNGTPYVVVLNAKGEAFPFAGSLPYQEVKKIIEKALASNEAGAAQ